MERLLPILTGAERDAADYHIISTTIPFVEESGNRAAVLGTSNFFEFGGRFFLVTANHTFAHFDANRVGVPVNEEDNRRIFRTLGGVVRHYWADDALDVTAIEIPEGPLLIALRRTYAAIGVESLARSGQRFDQYVIVGYTREAALGGSGDLSPRAVKITSTPYEGTPPDDFEPTLEFLLNFEKDGLTVEGSLVPSPKLHGISGAAVWGVHTTAKRSGPLWTPQDAVRVVGVQTSYLSTSYVRCHDWSLLARLFKKIDPTLGAAIFAHCDAP
jgi:hypothetical protein